MNSIVSGMKNSIQSSKPGIRKAIRDSTVDEKNIPEEESYATSSEASSISKSNIKDERSYTLDSIDKRARRENNISDASDYVYVTQYKVKLQIEISENDSDQEVNEQSLDDEDIEDIELFENSKHMSLRRAKNFSKKILDKFKMK